MVRFNGMPNEIWPKESEHIQYARVYRATKSTETLKVSDFLPWNVEFHKKFEHKLKQFKELCQTSSMYSVSLFLTKEDLIKKLNDCPGLDKNTKSISVGFTIIDYGISTKADDTGHIDYYLYDYENKNPKEHFSIEEVR